jgi:hypothetical protein
MSTYYLIGEALEGMRQFQKTTLAWGEKAGGLYDSIDWGQCPYNNSYYPFGLSSSFGIAFKQGSR